MIPMRLRLPPARWLLALLGLGVAVVALSAWLVLRGTPSEAAAAHYAPLVRTLQFSARVATLSRVEVGSTVTGRVDQVLVREGDQVRAEQRIEWQPSRSPQQRSPAASGDAVSPISQTMGR